MIVAGIMSGTSADGIDVAIVRILGRGADVRFELLGHEHLYYPRNVQQAVLKAMNARKASVADLARLNFLLGELYAEAVLHARKSIRADRLELIGCHGQTLYHQGEPAMHLGREISCTWQTGEGAVIAARTGVPVVSDFRPADMAAGGKGAPLVPFLDYVLFRSRRVGRIVQNIGGIANLTALPAGVKPAQVLAFDTGPGNMVMDQLMELHFQQPFDREGETAARGKILKPVLEDLLDSSFFDQKPPRTAGREEFGREYVRSFVHKCGRASPEDMLATATALTARSIGRSIKRFVLSKGDFREYVVSGGGTKNSTLMKMLAAELLKFNLKVRQCDDFGLPSQAKEAVAFALLAYQTWNRQPGNIPSATGATRPAVLGKISHA